MSLLRLIWYPKVAIHVLADFSQTSFLGTIPIAFDTIIVGIQIFYYHHPAAIWSAFGLYWASVFLTMCVVCGSVFAVYHHQEDIELTDVTGV